MLPVTIDKQKLNKNIKRVKASETFSNQD